MDLEELFNVNWFHLSEFLEDFKVFVIRENGTFHLKETRDGLTINSDTLLFPMLMGYFGIHNTAQLLDASPSKRTAIVLARKLDLLYQ